LFALVSLSVKLKFVSTQFEHQPTAGIEVLLAALWVCLPFGIATWWMFRVLKARYTRRQAKAVGIAFAVFTPVSLGVSMLLAEGAGSFIGAIISIAVTNTLLSFAVCLFRLQMTRLNEKIEQTN
jgi:ABC-type molybdate transport system permease subunit